MKSTILRAIAFCLPLIATGAYAQNITGVVFRDFNANGVKDNTATFNEIGAGGVTVTCTDGTGGTGSTTTSTSTATLGQYTLTGCTGATRVEFTWSSSNDFSGPVGTGSNTSVQFINATRTNINFAINYPANYSIPNPDVPVAAFAGGPLTASFVANLPVVTSDPYNSRVNGGPLVNPTHDKKWATAGQVGSVYGIAYSPLTDKTYTSAYVKRHTQLGAGNGGNPSGFGSAGAIYALSNPPSGGGGPATVSVLLDIGAAAGTTARTPASNWTCDPAMYEVGRVGWGDVDASPDGATLWAMNLNNKSLYKINATSGAILGTYPIPGVTGGPAFDAPVTTNENLDFRPFGLKVTSDKVYVGVVSSGESLYPAGGLPDPCNGATGYPALRGYVFEFSISGSTYSTTPVLDFPFQGASWNNGTCNNYGTGDKWSYWMPQSITTSNYGNWKHELRNPAIADIEIDTQGNLLIGLRNITNDRLAGIPGIFYPNCTTDDGAGQYGGFAGQTLKACGGPTTWTIESGGVCGGVSGFNTSVFYDYETPHSNGNHGGSIGYKMGSGEFLVPGSPGGDLGGMYFVSEATKAHAGNYNSIYALNAYPLDPNFNPLFGKANGLGDVELISPPAPIEIGNRVWLDADNDGIQDAGEAGISGVQVQLIKSGSTISTVTTDANGNYIFSSATGTDGTGKDYGITQLVPNMAYTVRFPTTATVSGTTYNLTTAAAGANRLIDSNAPSNGDVTVLATDIPIYGANNHSFDVGYSITPPGSLQITKTVTGAPGGFVSPNYTIHVDCSDNSFDQDVTLTNGGSQTITGIPAGTTCTVTEPTQPAAPVGYTYGTAVINPSGAQTITSGTTVSVTVTNPLSSVSCPTISVTPNPLTAGTVGVAYSASPSASASAGGPYTYTWSATGLPTGLSVNAGSGAVAGTPSVTGTATITASTTVAGQTCSGTTSLTIAPAAPVCTTITNTARVHFMNETDGNTGDNEDSVDVSANCTIFDLALDKKLGTGQSSTVAIGDLVNFEITVYNQGSVTASGIQITDYVDTTKFDAFSAADNPSGTTTGSVSLPYSWSGSGVATITGSLATNQNLKLPVKLRIKAGATGTATNTAEISAASGGTDIDSTPDGTNGNTSGEQAPNLEDNQILENGTGGNDEDDHDPASVTILAVCAINTPTVTPTCNNNGTPSDPADDTFTFTISATGSNTGANYKVDKIAPAPTSTVFASVNYGATSAASAAFPIAGGNLTLTLTDNTSATCTNTPVTVTAPPTCSSVAPQADLELTKTSSSPAVRPGDTLTYTLTLVNKGPGTANGVVVRDVLPASLSFVSATTATGSYNNATGLWTLGNIAPGTYTLTINVTVN